MATRKFRQGMTIIIPHNLSYTEQKCGCSPTMHSMSGHREKINTVYDSGKLSIGGYIWDSRDFTPPSPPKKIPIAHFDPEELVT